jgi:hypothetical protein
MTTIDLIASKIIREQERIIGPLAWTEAGKVQGLSIVDTTKGEVAIGNGNPKEVVDRLVNRYEQLFGRASHEVCKDAARGIIAELPPAEVPSSLQS